MEPGSAIRALHQGRFYSDKTQTWFAGHSVRLRHLSSAMSLAKQYQIACQGNPYSRSLMTLVCGCERTIP
jgi:hypothetical protein